MLKVLDKPYASLTIDPHNQILFQKWIGYINVEDFKAVIDQSVNCFKENQPLSYILSDTSEQAVLAKEGSDYASSVMPQLMALGLKKVAFIIPKSAFTKLSLDLFFRKTEKKMVQNFATRAEAISWLLTV